ncbi:MAG: hypothetical protein AAF502_02430 [Bacteroidota bacterium]
MVAANDILQRRDEIRHFIAINKLEQAIKRLMDFIKDFDEQYQDDVILISMDYYDWKEEKESGETQRSQIKMEKRRLAARILDTMRFVLEKL